MSLTLHIEELNCIHCGKCVKVCPSMILTQKSPGDTIAVDATNCISCGHCVAICPTGSVHHSHFPPEKVHPIDRTQLPTPDQVMLLCRARRSNRSFSDHPIPRKQLDQILEAAYRAPTASNCQQVAFTLITEPEKLRMITQFTIDTFTSITHKLENPLLRPLLRRMMPNVYKYLPAFHRLVREWNHGNDLVLRGATAVILIHTPKQNRFGVIDANLAYQNGSLMAESFGVSQFYMGFVYSAIQQDKKNRLARMLGIDGAIHAGMALGMPQFLFPNYIDKKPINLRD